MAYRFRGMREHNQIMLNCYIAIGAIMSLLPRSNPCVSLRSSPMPLIPPFTQRSISITALSPASGCTEQKTYQASRISCNGFHNIVIGFAAELMTDHPILNTTEISISSSSMLFITSSAVAIFAFLSL